MALGFRRFRSRILVFVAGLLALVQTAAFAAVERANVRNARLHVEETLALTADAFRRSLFARERILLEKARLLSSDFAFKEAVATGEHATLLSALENHRARVAASLMLLLSPDGRVLADTRGGRPGLAFERAELLAVAMDDEYGEASAIELLGGRPSQLVVVPLFAPEPTAWIVIGFAVDDELARELEEQTGTQVSLLVGGEPFASTLPDAERAALGEARPGGFSSRVAGREYVSFGVAEGAVLAVLQRPLDAALAPYLRLRALLAGIFAGGLALCLLGAALVAARVTKPVASLARGAARVAEGDYAHSVVVTQRDELGVLADTFNRMTRGLAERDRVRSLLGKVVSPAVAEELLRKEIELGGEERLASVLFADLRGFTALAERTAPQSLVGLLNTYLTRASAVVERHEGVVDKYIGDAVMAVFGAPLAHADDALRAVRAALELRAGVDDPRLSIGIGVSTGMVVAGNMGSTTRLNYTVIGDSVNVASRLEGLTRHYGVPVIVNQSTRHACPGVVFRELDRVRVKGREEAFSIFEPLCLEAELSAQQQQELARWGEALASFRARAWERAARGFDELAALRPDLPLYSLYRERARRFAAQPPGEPSEEWDGTTTWREK